jgi:predicted nucleotide-binding protein
MARRPTTHTRPERPHHTVEEKRQDILRLQRRIAEVEAFDPSQATKRFSDPAVTALQTAIGSTLTAIFGHGTAEYGRYSAAAQLDHGSISMGGTWGRGYRDEVAEARQYLAEGKAQTLALLNEAIRSIEEEIEFAAPQAIGVSGSEYGPAPAQSTREPTREVFVVHGHDEGARESVARYLEKIGFKPIILHEQANMGRTVVEKIEAHGDVDFAVVLLTPDDEGCVHGGNPEPRARQNVLLELGYFIGKLGRANVCALKRGVVEIPSDFAGVVWEAMENGGSWKQALARELQAAGHEIDWNQVMKA